MGEWSGLADGRTVTVQALCPMPTVAEGQVLTVTLGPRLRALIAAGRFKLLGVADTADVAAAGVAPAGGATARIPRARSRPASTQDGAADGADG